MKTFYAFGFFFLFISFSNAQSEWVKGSVVLKDNRVLVGAISKKPTHELILLKNNDGVMALPSHQVSTYRFYDEDSNINRQFLSVETSDLFRSFKFFEIVIQGNVKVLRRYHKQTLYTELNEGYDFDYFALIENSLIPLSRFKRDVFPKLLEKHPIEISAFVSVNELPLKSIQSAFSIIKHFNTIDKKSDILAQVD